MLKEIYVNIQNIYMYIYSFICFLSFKIDIMSSFNFIISTFEIKTIKIFIFKSHINFFIYL